MYQPRNYTNLSKSSTIGSLYECRWRDILSFTLTTVYSPRSIIRSKMWFVTALWNFWKNCCAGKRRNKSPNGPYYSVVCVRGVGVLILPTTRGFLPIPTRLTCTNNCSLVLDGHNGRWKMLPSVPLLFSRFRANNGRAQPNQPAAG